MLPFSLNTNSLDIPNLHPEGISINYPQHYEDNRPMFPNIMTFKATSSDQLTVVICRCQIARRLLPISFALFGRIYGRRRRRRG